jgi:hypothetical protein
MREVCYCGRVDEVEERKPVTDGDGRERVFAGAKHRADERRVPAA